MQAALLVRFNPTTPWRPGSPAGARDAVHLPIGSDTVFSALTLAMRDLGWLEEWLAAATAETGATVRLSSMFPFGGRHLFVTPPANLWPPEQTGRVRWESARFIPLTLIPALLRDEALSEDRWAADPVSGCLLPVEKFGVVTPPFRQATRVTAAVDRLGQSSADPREVACIQFAPGAGMWLVVAFSDGAAAEQWRTRVQAACRLLADAGIGGERSSGWGKSDAPVFEEIDLMNRFCGSSRPVEDGELGYWLLSLFSPAESDEVDWRRGNYNVVLRNGRMAGTGALKTTSRMVREGSVLIAPEAPKGAVLDVAPEGAMHPVYRSGAAVAIPIPWRETHRLSWLGADRAATEPSPVPVAAPENALDPAPESAARETETGAPEMSESLLVTEPVAEPVPVESEPVEDHGTPEALTEPGPVESEPVTESGTDAPAVADDEAAPSAPSNERSPDSVPDQELATEMPVEQEPPTSENVNAQDEPTPAEPPREEPPPDETPVQEPPTDVPPAEPPIDDPTPTETPIEEPGPDEPERKLGGDAETPQ